MALTDWNVINLKSYINEGAHSKNMKIGTNTKWMMSIYLPTSYLILCFTLTNWIDQAGE